MACTTTATSCYELRRQAQTGFISTVRIKLLYVAARRVVRGTRPLPRPTVSDSPLKVSVNLVSLCRRRRRRRRGCFYLSPLPASTRRPTTTRRCFSWVHRQAVRRSSSAAVDPYFQVQASLVTLLLAFPPPRKESAATGSMRCEPQPNPTSPADYRLRAPSTYRQ